MKKDSKKKSSVLPKIGITLLSFIPMFSGLGMIIAGRQVKKKKVDYSGSNLHFSTMDLYDICYWFDICYICVYFIDYSYVFDICRVRQLVIFKTK